MPLTSVSVPLPAGYGAALLDGGVLVVADERADVIPHVLDVGTLHAWARSRPCCGSIASGRGDVIVADVGAGERWVVRHAIRGGALGPLLHDRYLRVGVPRTIAELRVSAAARARGVDTPAVVAAAVYRAGPAHVRGDVATRWIPGSADLAAVAFSRRLFDEPSGAVVADFDVEDACETAGRAARLAAERGLVHRDLNLRNLLVARQEGGLRAWLLDLDGARVDDPPRPGRAGDMLRRFERSWRKWERRTGERRPEGMEAFRRGWRAAGAGLPSGAGGAS